VVTRVFGRLTDLAGRRWQRLRRRSTLALAVALAFVAVMRVLPFSAVYREGDVVLSSNDPYFYRYLVEQLLATASGPFDVGVLASLPEFAAKGEPLTIATLWWVAEVAGGGPFVTGSILAWYPVVSALVTAFLAYHLAVHLSGDRRVGLAAVGFFAVVPGHVFRTGLGFADHHAFDYPWLILTALAFVRLATDEVTWPPSRGTASLVALLAAGVSGQLLAWEAGPLLLVPLALGIAVYAPFAASEGDTGSVAAVAAGLAGGAVLVGGAHVGLGWQSPAVAVTPVLLCAGAAGLALCVAVAARLDHPARAAAAVVVVELVALGVLAAVVSAGFPSVAADLERGVSTLQSPTAAGEMQSVTATWGPLFGPLIMLGFAPFLAVPAMLWTTWDAVRRRAPGWLLLSLYAWMFLGLSYVQRRFTGELTPFVTVFAGLGFVGLCGFLDLVTPPAFLRQDDRVSADGGASSVEPPEADHGEPEPYPGSDPDLRLPGRRRALLLGAQATVFASFPALYSANIHPRVTIDRRKHAAARWMEAYAADRDWVYPDSYVLSEWGENRMYNYFVNGNSQSYSFARRTFGEFLAATTPAEWYERLRSRVGFVVTTEAAPAIGFGSDRIYRRLHGAFGSRRSGRPGVAHYRAVYASSDDFLKVFTLVPGATVAGRGPADDAVSLRTDVSIPGGSFTYRRRAETDEAGRFSVTVAHPGTYQVGDTEVTVSETAVTDGGSVEAGQVGERQT
jgi:dolichyl-diphosphooligosaccharide--protein glycosyltransferase